MVASRTRSLFAWLIRGVIPALLVGILVLSAGCATAPGSAAAPSADWPAPGGGLPPGTWAVVVNSRGEAVSYASPTGRISQRHWPEGSLFRVVPGEENIVPAADGRSVRFRLQASDGTEVWMDSFWFVLLHGKEDASTP